LHIYPDSGCGHRGNIEKRPPIQRPKENEREEINTKTSPHRRDRHFVEYFGDLTEGFDSEIAVLKKPVDDMIARNEKNVSRNLKIRKNVQFEWEEDAVVDESDDTFAQFGERRRFEILQGDALAEDY
jgi:hypothetical protein